MKGGRGVKSLPNSNGIYYARGYTEGARIYFQYSGDDISILAESNKPTQNAVIEFLLKNFETRKLSLLGLNLNWKILKKLMTTTLMLL
jgi:hypothetical protein